MSNEVLKYIAYCIEVYKENKKMTGKEVANYFKEKNIFDFIEKYFIDLHTKSKENLILDIDEYVSGIVYD